ncbi:MULTISPECIES: putative leader peptide [Pseudonocardia]
MAHDGWSAYRGRVDVPLVKRRHVDLCRLRSAL